MFTESIMKLRLAADRNDLQSLEAGLKPVWRTINRSNGFHAALMLSAHNVKHLSKIPTTAADCIMLNLEDGVSPEQKPVALRLCQHALAAMPQSSKKIVVRVNPLDEGGEEEILALNAYRPDAVRIPKVRSVDDVNRALTLLDEEIELHLSIETKESWLALAHLRRTARVRTFYLGILDLFADLGLNQALLTPDNPTFQSMLSHFLITSRALDVKPVSFVYQDYQNDAGFREWLALEKRMGFDAKGCVSPKQAQMVLDAFAIDAVSLDRARKIVEKFEAMQVKGVTGFADEEFGFIDEPIYKGALAVLRMTS